MFLKLIAFFFIKDNSVSWQKTNQLAAPFFLLSLAPTANKQAFDNISKKELNEQQKSNVSLWELEGTRRIIESGFVLRSMIHNEDEHFIDNVKLLYNNEWKTNTYKVNSFHFTVVIVFDSF